MVDIPLARSDYRRGVARAPDVLLRNRYYEQNPVLTAGPVGLIARPGKGRLSVVGDGPGRALYSAPGAFSGDLFFVSGLVLYRMDSGGTVTTVGQIGTQETDAVSFAATGTLGTTPGHLFVTDGGILWCYTDSGYAIAHLTASGAISDTETVTIGGQYYKWTSGAVDTGTPAGTVGAPWLVALGGTTAVSLTNLFNAINDSGVPGTTYSTLLVANTSATAYSRTATALYVRAIVNGTVGNAIAVAETMTNGAWNGTTLAGGGSPSLLQVPMPDDVGAIGLGHINSYVIVIPAQNENINGRFYWINPGETTIDPLDFATAERSPDAVNQVVVFSDRFWLLGENTVETWITTGNVDAPMLRTQGILFDRGTWEGAAIQVNDRLVLVDPFGGVFEISGGGQVTRISRPDIEERLRGPIQRSALAY